MCNNYQNSNSEKPASAEPPRPRASRDKAGSPADCRTPGTAELYRDPWDALAEAAAKAHDALELELCFAAKGLGPSACGQMLVALAKLPRPKLPQRPRVNVGGSRFHNAISNLCTPVAALAAALDDALQGAGGATPPHRLAEAAMALERIGRSVRALALAVLDEQHAVDSEARRQLI